MEYQDVLIAERAVSAYGRLRHPYYSDGLEPTSYCLDAPERLPAGSSKAVRTNRLEFSYSTVALREGWEA